VYSSRLGDKYLLIVPYSCLCRKPKMSSTCLEVRHQIGRAAIAFSIKPTSISQCYGFNAQWPPGCG
jgi:hypothetical protein